MPSNTWSCCPALDILHARNLEVTAKLKYLQVDSKKKRPNLTSARLVGEIERHKSLHGEMHGKSRANAQCSPEMSFVPLVTLYTRTHSLKTWSGGGGGTRHSFARAQKHAQKSRVHAQTTGQVCNIAFPGIKPLAALKPQTLNQPPQAQPPWQLPNTLETPNPKCTSPGMNPLAAISPLINSLYGCSCGNFSSSTSRSTSVRHSCRRGHIPRN